MDEFIKLRKFLNNEIDAINRVINNFGVNDVEKKEYQGLKEKIEKILGHFSDYGIKEEFKSIDERNYFFKIIKDKLPKKDIMVIIREMTKATITFRDQRKEELIRENNIRKEMRKKASELIPKTYFHEKVDTTSFTSKEKVLFDEIERIYNEKLSDNIIPTSFIDKDTTEHEYWYLLDNRYNWGVILADIKENILDMFKTSKDKAMYLFVKIKDYYDISKQKKVKWNSLINELDEIRGKVEDLKFNSLVKGYNGEYDYVILHPESVNLKTLNKSMEYIRLAYCERNALNIFEKKLTSCIEKLNKAINEDMINFDIDIESIKNSYKDISSEYARLDNEYRKMLVKGKENISDEYNLSQSTNLVFVLEDNITFDGSPKDSFDKLKTFVYAGDMLDGNTIDSSGIQKNLDYLKKTLSTSGQSGEFGAKNGPIMKTPLFSVKRYRHGREKRVGVVQFEINPVIKKKLMERYQLKENFVIFGLFDAIISHDDYHQLVKYAIPFKKVAVKNGTDADVKVVENYNDEITRLAYMLTDYKCDFELLCQIIEKGIDDFRRIKKDLLKYDADEKEKSGGSNERIR